MEGKKNVGIWIRVSTDMQVQDESPEHHEKRARMYAEAKGWNVITIYRLDALSGKSVMDYTETKRMLKDIQAGTISGIIFSRLSRLARNTKELLEISELFREQNADLISLAEAIDTSSPAGRLFFTIIAAMAQWEREEIAERVAASVPIRAKMGKPLGGAAPFGYKWEGKELLVDEAEAPVRKLMYEIFLKTKRKKTTADELNNLGHRTRNGSKFTDTTVDRLLKDPTAKGLRIANYTKSLGEGKNWVLKPESDWIKLPCPAVVSENIWNDCNSILADQYKKRNVGPRTVHLLAGYVYCTCGSKMYVFTESPVYKCKKCKTKIAVADIDEIYHEQLKAFLITDVDMDTYNLRSQTSILEKESLLKTTKNEFQKLKKKSEEIINLRIENEISKEDFQSIYKPLEEQLRQLENQIPELEAEIDFLKIQFLNYDTIQQDAKDLYSNWVSLPYEERRSVIETITDRLVVGTDAIDIKLAYQPIPSLTNSLNGENSPRNSIPAVPFSTLDNKIRKPLGSKYLEMPKTIGDKIRNRRLELGLLQKQVADKIGVSEDCITLWENNKSEPHIHYYPILIQFLGYSPVPCDVSSLAGKLKNYRIVNGLTQEELALKLQINESTVYSLERDKHAPSKRTSAKIKNILTS